MKNAFVMSCLGLLLTGCTSYFVRQSCKEINWYQHGFDVAMKGQRLNQDTTLQKCRDAEAEIPESQVDLGFKAGMANYCRPEEARKIGKRGEFLTTELCEPAVIKRMKAEHEAGVLDFCAPTNAFTVGASGVTYNKICPSSMEAKFMPEYVRGRKRFLQAAVIEGQKKTSDLDQQIHQQNNSIHRTQMELNYIPPPQKVVQKTQLPSGIVQEQTSYEDPHQARRTNLENEISGLRRQLNGLMEQKRKNDESTRQYQRELLTYE